MSKILSIFNSGTNLDLTGGKYFIKTILDIKMEIGLAVGKYFIKIIFDIIWAINNGLYANKLLYPDKLFYKTFV